MTERKHTGGTREFRYSKEESERIRSADTGSSRAFKEAYGSWNEKRQQEALERLRAQERMLETMRKRLIVGLVVVVIMLTLLMVLRVF